MAAPLDHLTVLVCTPGKLATKRHTAAGIKDYSLGTWFALAEWPLADFSSLAAELAVLQTQPRAFIVRGRIVEGTDRRRAPRRKLPRPGEPATLAPQARRWILLDFDSVDCPPHIEPLYEPDRVVEHLAEMLPEPFHGVSCHWAFTSGMTFKLGIRARLAYWLDRAVSDQELKIWLAGAPVDRSLFDEIQPHFTGAPVFDTGMADPVPHRHGVWRGYADTVAVPLIEKPPKARSPAAARPFTGTSGGSGYEHHLNRLGDGEGRDGFFAPTKSAVAAFLRAHGAAIDTAFLRADLERAVRAAGHSRDAGYIERRVADLDPLIRAIRDLQAADEAAAARALPTYPAPPVDITLDAARTKLAQAMRDVNAASLAYIASDAAAPPPVIGINADVGIGKTTAWCMEVARPHTARGLHPVLMVPRHKLAGQIVADFAKAGIVARDFRGRGYDDPAQPGKMMCHERARIEAIEGAGIGNIARQACRDITGKCRSCNLCGYEQQKREKPDVWLVPHQMLTRQKPAFIECDVLGIDESFWATLLHGVEHRITLELNSLVTGDRVVPFDPAGTADLIEISGKVYDLLMAGPDGRLRRAELTAALQAARISAEALRNAGRQEASRRIDPGVSPGMPVETVKERCGRVAAHNAEAIKLAKFWELLADTVTGTAGISPWLDLAKDSGEPEIHLAWVSPIHASWRNVPTVILDATLPRGIVRRFYPDMQEPVQITAATPHARIVQITDVPMSKNRLIPIVPKNRLIPTDADTRENKTRFANVERVRRFIEYEAFKAGPGKVAVICNMGLETLLLAGRGLPGNVVIDHFNNVSGENRFADVAVLILIGRPEAPALVAEQIARVLFAADIVEIAADAAGRVNYPLVRRGLRTRGGTVAVNGPQHPDPLAELIRWTICEGSLIQTNGRPRPASRTVETQLRIILLTNVVLPIVVDETTTWDAIQPTERDIMLARGAVPVSYGDMATAYPDLFPSAEAARKALGRENPGQTPIEKFPSFLIGICPGFLSVAYRKRGSRGPAGRLLYDPARIDPLEWLVQKLGEVTVLGVPRPVVADTAAEPAPAPAPLRDPADAAPSVRPCAWVRDSWQAAPTLRLAARAGHDVAPGAYRAFSGVHGIHRREVRDPGFRR